MVTICHQNNARAHGSLHLVWNMFSFCNRATLRYTHCHCTFPVHLVKQMGYPTLVVTVGNRTVGKCYQATCMNVILFFHRSFLFFPFIFFSRSTLHLSWYLNACDLKHIYFYFFYVAEIMASPWQITALIFLWTCKITKQLSFSD